MTQDELDELNGIKEIKINQINIFSDQGYINYFTFNGIQLKMLYEDRARFKLSLDAYKLLGKETMTKYFCGHKITFNLKDYNKLLYMLLALEVYYSECWNVTQQHLKFVQEATKISDIYNFDVTADYPEQLVFTND